TPSTATCRLSCASTSATETLNPCRSRSFMLLTTCRLSLSVRASRISRRTRREPTVMGHLVRLAASFWERFYRAQKHAAKRLLLLQRSLHLFDAIRFDHVADLDIVVAGNFEAAFEAFAYLAHILLEALERVEPSGAVGGRVDDDGLANHADLRRPLNRA